MKLFTLRKVVIVAMLAMTCSWEAFAQSKAKQSSGSVIGESSSRGDLDGTTKKVKMKYNTKTDVVFGDTDISGAVKNPFASMLTSRDPKIQSGFLRIRYNWHDMLVMSASGLSQ